MDTLTREDKRAIRTINRCNIYLNKLLERKEIDDLITEEEAAAFLEVGVRRFRNMVYDGTIPAAAIVTLVNNTKKFRKHLLIK